MVFFQNVQISLQLISFILELRELFNVTLKFAMSVCEVHDAFIDVIFEWSKPLLDWLDWLTQVKFQETSLFSVFLFHYSLD